MASNLYEVLGLDRTATSEDSAYPLLILSHPSLLSYFSILHSHYSTLTTNSFHSTVRKAYRKRALKTHPDRLPQGVSDAERQAANEQFRLVRIPSVFSLFTVYLFLSFSTFSLLFTLFIFSIKYAELMLIVL